MSKRTIYDCDQCLTKDIQPVSFSVTVDHITASNLNGDYIASDKRFDVCPKCASTLLSVLLNTQRKVSDGGIPERSFEDNRKFIKQFIKE